MTLIKYFALFYNHNTLANMLAWSKFVAFLKNKQDTSLAITLLLLIVEIITFKILRKMILFVSTA